MSWNFDRKNLALIGIGLGLVAAAIAFSAPQRTPALIVFLWLGVLGSVACLAILARLQFQRDLVPDYLGLCQGSFFERDGFCFTVSLGREEHTAIFTVMFQNRYIGPSVARIALRPSGSRVATVSPTIQCGPAGFGVAKFPVAIPARHQGKTVLFEIGVQTDYPMGKGRAVRFRSGRPVHHDARFRNLAVLAKTLLHAVAGHIVIHSAAAIRLTLPADVAEDLPDDATGHAEELWSLPKNEPLWYAMER